jgi:hypothetical protein
MFHAKDGWFFERTADGGVHIVKRQEAKDDAPLIAQTYFDHASWCSIIASVCWQGENSESWDLANEFHGHATE